MEDLYHRVWDLVRRIPRGRVMTYGQIAEVLGYPGRARAVGFAMRHSPHNVPWHRVVSSRGIVSQRPDRESMREQRHRLESEGVEFDAEDHLPLLRLLWEPPEAE